MNRPLQITFRDMDPSPAMEDCVRAHAKKLERICPRLTSCQVTIESPHRHKTHGREFRVRIEVGVPGDVLVVSGAHVCEDAYAVINGTFSRAERHLSGAWHRSQRLRQSA